MHRPELVIRQMRRDELDVLVEWAAEEGWNPGLSDAELFWATEPEAFIAAELAGELIGGGSIVSYGGHYGYMGFFIIHPDYRGRGLGNKLWHERLRRLLARLDEPAVIGMDGVFDLQAYYARGGFEFAGRDLRFEVTSESFSTPEEIIELCEIPFSDIAAYDRAHFPAPRDDFLRRWQTTIAHGLGHFTAQGVDLRQPCERHEFAKQHDQQYKCHQSQKSERQLPEIRISH